MIGTGVMPTLNEVAELAAIADRHPGTLVVVESEKLLALLWTYADRLGFVLSDVVDAMPSPPEAVSFGALRPKQANLFTGPAEQAPTVETDSPIVSPSVAAPRGRGKGV